MSDAAARMVMRSVYLPEDLDERLRSAAFKLRTSKADLIRTFVQEGLTQLQQTHNPISTASEQAGAVQELGTIGTIGTTRTPGTVRAHGTKRAGTMAGAVGTGTLGREGLFEERGEELVVAKEGPMTEELVVRRDVGQRTERISETVRSTEVDVEDERGDALSGIGTINQRR